MLTTLVTVSFLLLLFLLVYLILQRILNAINAFKAGQKEWRAEIGRMFEGFREKRITRTDLIRLVNYFILQLDREMIFTSEKSKAQWEQYCMPQLTVLTNRCKHISEMEQKLTEILGIAAAELKAVREQGKQTEIAMKMKRYIEEHAVDPNLSLHLVSMELNMNPSYLSRVFKDHFNERFIDYLTRLRIRKAKKMLIDTEWTVHEIAEKVGYFHSFSFIRAFKKTENITPGEFRRLHGRTETNVHLRQDM